MKYIKSYENTTEEEFNVGDYVEYIKPGYEYLNLPFK